MSDLFLLAMSILFCSAMTAFFAGSETGAISANRHRLRTLQMSGDQRAADVIHLLSDTQKVLTATLVGTNLFSILGVLFAKEFFSILLRFLTQRSSESLSNLLSLVVMTPFLLIAGEVIPKQIFRQHADNLMLFFRKPLRLFSLLFNPAVTFFTAVTFFLLRPFGIKKGARRVKFTREDLKSLVGAVDAWVSEGKEFPPSRHEVDMIQSIFNLEKTLVREVMKPLVDIIAIPLHGSTTETVIETAKRTGYTRIPVYENTIVNMVGYVDVYDILRSENIPWKDLKSDIHGPYYVPETKRIDDLLQELLSQHRSVAIAFDEYGGCSGFVTLEDILEEIVGEIEDEFDKLSIFYYKEKPDVYIVDPRMDLDDLKEEINITLPKHHCETLGGFIYTTLGRVPQPNELITFGDYRIYVTEVIPPKIKRVRIEQVKQLG